VTLSREVKIGFGPAWKSRAQSSEENGNVSYMICEHRYLQIITRTRLIEGILFQGPFDHQAA